MSTDNALDGNGVGGVLAAVFGTDMTTAQRRCAVCGDTAAIGRHRAYLGAATVLRCPSCDAVAARIATLDDRHLVELSGTWVIAG
jgi:hypothetical protein